MRILRIFPRKGNSFTPRDELCFCGDPPLWRPPIECVDEVHVSVTFTWDILEGQRLMEAWNQYYPIVKIGGPAFGTANGHFVPGRYVKQGVTFTTRGCNNHCDHCLVPEWEGPLVPYEHFSAGYIVQDNNLLQAPAKHRRRVFVMLSEQSRAAQFKGGLQASLVTDEIADELRGLRISEAWLAADDEGALKPLAKAVEKLSFLGLRSNRLRCYVLIGKGKDTPQKAEARLEAAWSIGCLPFAQLYQPPELKRKKYSREWRDLARKWSRPAVIRSSHGKKE